MEKVLARVLIISLKFYDKINLIQIGQIGRLKFPGGAFISSRDLILRWQKVYLLLT